MEKSKSTVRFAPWVGLNYERGLYGLRILLVGESHYAAKQHERPTVTAEIIKALALGERHPQATRKLPRKKHFTLIMSAVLNIRHRFSNTQRKEFWDSVAYYNFIQEFLPTSRIAPTADAWKQGEKAFTKVLEVLAPDLIICLSLRNGDRIKSLAGSVPVAVVNHPSSHFAYSKVNPVIATHIEMAREKKTMLTSEFVNTELFEQWLNYTYYALPTPGSYLSESDKIAILNERRKAMEALDKSLVP